MLFLSLTHWRVYTMKLTKIPLNKMGEIRLCACAISLGQRGLMLAAVSLVFLSACISYRAEVVQGNMVTKEMVAQLRPGMDSNAVLNIMGTPLVTSVFHENRWDYVFTLDRQGLPKQHRTVTLHFKDQRLDRIEGGQDLPTDAEFAASLLKK
jgi:outer membrane protein assembly factor BamE